MGWQDQSIAVSQAPASVPAWMAGSQPAAPVAPRAAPPREASGVWDSFVAGYQGSATGMLLRGKLPDIVLDPHHSKWYERALSGVATMASELPEMIAGTIAGSALGGAVSGPAAPVGALLGGGAGMMAVPAEIRESLVRAYQNGDADSSTSFLARVGIAIRGLGDKEVMTATAKAAAVGAATMGVGGLAAKAVGGALAPAAGQGLRVVAARTAGELGAMTVAPAALEGRLPEMQDFADAAIVVVGMKGATAAAGKLAKIYAKTGIEPAQVAADARADPSIAESLRGPGDEIPAAYKPAAEAEMLRNALPEAPKVAEIMANPRGTITDGKEPNHINYRYTESAEDVQALRAKIAETFKPEIEAARGKESWAETHVKAQAVIANRLAGMSPEKQAELTSMKFEDLAAQSMAVEAMAQRAAFDARAAATEIARKGNEATPEDAARLAAAISQAALLHEVDQGNGAAIARALNSRKAAKERGALADSMQAALAEFGEDPHVLARMVLGLHTTAQMTKFAKDAAKAGIWEKIVEAWKASILSGPITQVANLVGNTTFAALRPVVDLVASGISKDVSAAEPFSRIFGNLQGAKDALVFAGSALQTAYGEGGIRGVIKAAAVGSEAELGKSEQFRKAIEGTKGDIIRLPFRALSLADDFFKLMNSQGERYALATRQAVKEGFNLSTREFRERVVDLVQNDAKIAEAGDKAALRLTFNTPLGEKGLAVQNLVKKANLQLLVPFIRTPANIFKEMVRMTPLAPVIGEWRKAYEAGGAERAKAVSEMAMGTAISAVVASYVMDGSITGQGSADPNKRRVEEAAGKQPYSIKIGDTWYSYQRLQPVGTLMGMAADLTTVWHHVSEEEGNKGATMLSVAFANAVTQQTFLQGITSIVQVLADPERYGTRFVQQYAGSLVPSIIAQPTAMADPLQREIHGIVDAVKARIHGLRETLQPKINVLTGQPMEAKERAGEILPITEAQVSKDPVLSEAARLGVGVAKAPKSVELSTGGLDKKLGKLELTPEQQTIFASASGELAHRILTPLVTGDNWARTPDLIKKKIYATVIMEARKAGEARAIPPEQMAAQMMEIATKLVRKLQPQAVTQ